MVVSLSTLANTGTSIFWATGYRLMRITVPETAQGEDDGRACAAHALWREVLAVQSGRRDWRWVRHRSRPIASSIPARHNGRRPPSDLRRFVRALEERRVKSSKSSEK